MRLSAALKAIAASKHKFFFSKIVDKTGHATALPAAVGIGFIEDRVLNLKPGSGTATATVLRFMHFSHSGFPTEFGGSTRLSQQEIQVFLNKRSVALT
jgi:hypothetical protein